MAIPVHKWQRSVLAFTQVLNIQAIAADSVTQVSAVVELIIWTSFKGY